MSRTSRDSLTTCDFEMFRSFGIGPELLEAAGICRVTDVQARELWGIRFSSQADLSGVIIPYLNPLTGDRVSARLRRDHPEVDVGGKCRNKYICAFGDRRHIYFAPGAGELLRAANVPVLIVEAEKSALALGGLVVRTGRRLLVIGTGGCYGWRGKIGTMPAPNGGNQEIRGPLLDFDWIAWEGREAVVCFDSNAASNRMVRRARRELAAELAARGAKVHIAELPILPEVNGPDDLIAVSGDQAMQDVLDVAKPLPELAWAEANNALNTVGTNSVFADVEDVLDHIVDVSDHDAQKMLVARLASKLKGVFTKRELTGLAHSRATERRDEVAQLVATTRQARLLKLGVDPAGLVAELESFFQSRLYLRPNAALVIALWVLNTWTYEMFDTVGYLLVQSPTPQCGKTRLLQLLGSVCARARLVVNVSTAALFRMIEQVKPTLIIDEVEKLRSSDENSRDLLSVLHAGYREGLRVPRIGGPHNDELQEFETFGPKALACIGTLKGALLDRCIVIQMEKKPRGCRVVSARAKVIAREAESLRDGCEAYALQHGGKVSSLYAQEPDSGYWPEFVDREAELFGPLLLHARVAGFEERALEALRHLSANKQALQADERDFALARELLEAVENWREEKFAPSDLLTTLESRESWGDYLSRFKDPKAKAAAVGRFLGRFRLSSRERPHGRTQYSKRDVLITISKYLPDSSAVTAATSISTAESMTYAAADQEPSPRLVDQIAAIQSSGNKAVERVAADAAFHSPVGVGSEIRAEEAVERVEGEL